MEAARRALVVWALRAARVGDGGHDLPRDQDPVDGLVAAGWLLVSQKHWISALGLKRTLGIGSEQTAWAMLHRYRYRTAMVRPGRDRLSGVVEVDETYMGGPEPGRSGRGTLGKTLVAIAVEQRGRAIGRCRMQPIADAKAASLREFLLAHVQPGAVVISDDWRSYPPACAEDYEHRPEPVGPSELAVHELLPGAHRVASLAKYWLLGTHQGGVKPAHLGAYLDEFAFRFNRRRSRSRGMLFYRLPEQAVQAPPRTYRSLVADPGRGRKDLLPPGRDKRVRPTSLESETQDRPWRRSSSAAPDLGDILH